MNFIKKSLTPKNSVTEKPADLTFLEPIPPEEDLYGDDWVAEVSDNLYDRIDAIKPVNQDQDNEHTIYGTPLWLERASNSFADIREQNGAYNPTQSSNFQEYEERYQRMLHASRSTRFTTEHAE